MYNVSHYLSKFCTEGPQFIVLPTARNDDGCRCIVGVTMQESGVSKMVSVDVVDTLQESDN